MVWLRDHYLNYHRWIARALKVDPMAWPVLVGPASVPFSNIHCLWVIRTIQMFFTNDSTLIPVE